MFTVYCCDTFDGTKWEEKYPTREAAIAFADRTAGEMLVCYVDDPQGRKIYRAGIF